MSSVVSQGQEENILTSLSVQELLAHLPAHTLVLMFTQLLCKRASKGPRPERWRFNASL
jgi:hypothetical protein